MNKLLRSLRAGVFAAVFAAIGAAPATALLYDANGNLLVNVATGGGSGGTSSTFGAAFPSTGTAIGVKNGANMVNLTADGSNNLNINCAVGCTAGSVSNATSGVATSATNIGTAAYNYGFNGTTWDQFQVDASKFLKVNCATGCSGGALSNASDAVATSSTNGGQNVWLFGFNGTTFDRLRVDASKNLNVNISANSFGTFTVSGTVTANAGTNLNTSALALDTSVNGLLLAQASTTSGQKGPLAQGAVTTNAPAYTTAQSDPLSLDTSGLLRVSVKDTPANTNNFNINLAASGITLATNIGQVGGTATVNGGVAGSLAVGGPTASGVAIAANPLTRGGRAQNAEPTAVTNGQVVNQAQDLVGRAITYPYANKENAVTGTIALATGNTDTSFVAAPGVGLFIYVTDLACTNGGTSATLATFKNGNAGSIIFQMDVAPNGGGFTKTFNTPLGGALSMSSNTALFLNSSVATTSLHCNAQGFKGT